MTSAVIGPVVAEGAVLRMLAPADLELTRAWRNHPDSRQGFHSTAAIGPSEHLAWYRAYLERDDDFVFVLEVDERPVAQASLYDVTDGSAEFGRLLVDPELRGRGLSHRAIAMCLDVADTTMSLAEVHLEVKPGNTRAIRAYERAGFLPDDAAAGRDGSLIMRRRRS